MQVAAGSNSSLTGQSPDLVVEEMQSGRPSYTASYKPEQTGPYQVAVTQLLPGGLSATYWDNAWLFGSPAVQRVDAQVNERQASTCMVAWFDVGHVRGALSPAVVLWFFSHVFCCLGALVCTLTWEKSSFFSIGVFGDYLLTHS